MIPIQPLTIPTQGTANWLVLKCLTLDMTATFAQFYYEIIGNDKVMLSGNIEMTEAEYQNWGADNNYCIQWAANKLNITLA